GTVKEHVIRLPPNALLKEVRGGPVLSELEVHPPQRVSNLRILRHALAGERSQLQSPVEIPPLLRDSVGEIVGRRRGLRIDAQGALIRAPRGLTFAPRVMYRADLDERKGGPRRDLPCLLEPGQ